MLTAAAIAASLLALCACTGVLGLAQGDPGRDAGTVASAAMPAAPPGSPQTPDAAVSPTGGAISAVSVTLSVQAQQLAASDPRLNPDEIAVAVENELAAQHLYAPAAADVHRTLAVTVQDFTNSLASNAKVLGFTFRSVALSGDVKIKGDPAAPGPPFHVHARVRLSTRDSGAGAGSLQGLYARFAVLTVAALRGVESPPEAVPR
jgi:hypothetical protein